MPQMAPISWLILMIVFSISFIIFNIMNYYNFNKIKNINNNSLKMKTTNNFLIWKW